MYTRRDFPLLLIDEHYFQYNIYIYIPETLEILKLIKNYILVLMV